MGAKGSSLVGKAVISDKVLKFTEWDLDAVQLARTRHRQNLGGAFALGVPEFAQLLDLPESEADSLFHDTFDTDHNGLVDAYEVIGSLSMLANLSLSDKIDFIHSLYDFNGSGDITMDELTILMRTLVCGLAKVDLSLEEPSVEFLEALSRRAFTKADKDTDGEISKPEFDEYCLNSPTVREFLDYWAGAVNRAALMPGEVWSDATFQGGSALYRNQHAPPRGTVPPELVQWQRPSDMAPETPSLFGEGTGSLEITQGQLSDLWFLSALGVLTARPDALTSLFVTTGQESQGRYCVQFFKDGQWTNVYVDDRLPCNAALQPLYCRSNNSNEYWCMLAEKAYAKLHGSYEAIAHGHIELALRDITGGWVRKIDVESREGRGILERDELWGEMQGALHDGIVGCLARSDTSLLAKGILLDRAYAVLQIVESGEFRLVHLRNPWATREYNGPWSDGSKLWQANPEVAKECNWTSEPDGTFWMAFEDFQSIFSVYYLCRFLSNWSVSRREGSFPVSGGGCPNSAAWKDNPQYFMSLEEDAEVAVTVMQPDVRYHVQQQDRRDYDRAIGFIVVEHDWGTPDNVKELRSLQTDAMRIATYQMAPLRNLTESAVLTAGKYVIVPMSFAPNRPGTFFISAYAAGKLQVLGPDEVQFDDMPNKTKATNEIEGEFSVLQAANVDPEIPEMGLEDVSLAALGQLVADLTLEAGKLMQRKAELEEKIALLEG